MARHETEREDLMAEATAFRERIEYSVAGEAEPIMAGFRESGRWSLYFGSDPVYHFSADGALRRAFVEGDLFRSQGMTLARLTRVRTGDEVQLVRHDLTAAELEQFTSRMKEHLASLKAAIEAGSAQITRQIPDEAEIEAKLLEAMAAAARLRLAGAVQGRRTGSSGPHDRLETGRP
jgi:hypothetical protein